MKIAPDLFIIDDVVLPEATFDYIIADLRNIGISGTLFRLRDGRYILRLWLPTTGSKRDAWNGLRPKLVEELEITIVQNSSMPFGARNVRHF